MDCFEQDILTRVNVWYQSCDIIDTVIWDYKNGVWIQEEIVKDFVKSANMSILNFCILMISYSW